MPVRVSKRQGPRPYKIIEVATGRIVGSSASRVRAEASARVRNAYYKRKKS